MSTSHRVGDSARYAWPASSSFRNPTCDTCRALVPIVVYVCDQSTDSPSSDHSSKYFSSSIVVTTAHCSTKFGREIGIGCFGGGSLGVKSGSYGSDGSHVMPSMSWTRRSTFSPLSSHPIG
jgi:hypothetical protein